MKTNGKFKWIFIMFAIIVVVFLSIFFLLHFTENGKRFRKNVISNWNSGLERTVNIYDDHGNLIQSYSGRFGIEINEDKIEFDDANGKRHIIKGGIVIIDEK